MRSRFYRVLYFSNATPSGATCNLRFPGQYFDTESGLNYNYMRDYDPSLGRYVQSDPIGLEGGLNVHIYTQCNPVRYIDPTGYQAVILPPPVYEIPYIGPALAFGTAAALLNQCHFGEKEQDQSPESEPPAKQSPVPPESPFDKNNPPPIPPLDKDSIRNMNDTSRGDLADLQKPQLPTRPTRPSDGSNPPPNKGKTPKK